MFQKNPFAAILKGSSLPLDRLARDKQQPNIPATVRREEPIPHTGGLSEEEMSRVIRAVYRQGRMKDIPFLAVNTGAQLLLPAQDFRSYIFIQNQSAGDQIIVRFGQAPSFGPGVQGLGVVIPPNFGFYEPILVPLDEVWIIGGAASVPGILLYAV